MKSNIFEESSILQRQLEIVTHCLGAGYHGSLTQVSINPTQGPGPWQMPKRIEIALILPRGQDPRSRRNVQKIILLKVLSHNHN